MLLRIHKTAKINSTRLVNLFNLKENVKLCKKKKFKNYKKEKRFEYITENPTLEHKSMILLHPRFIPKTPIWGNKRYIPCLLTLFVHYTTEPSPLPVTQSALTPKEFLSAVYLFLKKQQLFSMCITRGSAVLCGGTGSCRFARIYFKDIWWGVFWSKKMKVLHQVQNESGGYYGEPLEEPYFRF